VSYFDRRKWCELSSIVTTLSHPAFVSLQHIPHNTEHCMVHLHQLRLVTAITCLLAVVSVLVRCLQAYVFLDAFIVLDDFVL